jgi:hypothetical protein
MNPNEPNEPMSKEEVERLKHNLSLMAKPHVEQAYRQAFCECALVNGRIPNPSTIQRLLCIWKILWRWKEK